MHINLKPLFALLTMSLLWGYAWTGLKIGLLDCPPYLFAALRMMLGALCLLLILGFTRHPFKPERVPELLLLGLVQTTALFTLSTWAVAQGSAGRVAFLAYTMPFFTLLLAWPLLGEKVRGLQWLAIACAAAGLVAIVQPWQESASLLSNVLAIGAGIAWALGAIMVKRLQRRAPMDLISMTAWQMFLGSIPLMGIAWLVPEAAIVWSPRFILVLILIGVVTTAFGWLLWVYVLDNMSAGTASLGTLAAPVVAMASSHYHFGEQPDPIELGGMALIVTALLVLSINALRGRRVPPSVTVQADGG